jgi:gluconolactonase
MPISIKRVTVFCEGLDHPECVCVGRDGVLYAGGEAGQIYRISKDGLTVEQIASTKGFNLGVAISPDNSWLAVCDLKNKCVWKLNLSTKRLSRFAAGDFSIPNHLAFMNDGSLFVTDSGSFRKVDGRIFKFDSQGRGGVWHAGPFNFANGIAVSPQADAVMVCCTWLPGVERVAIRPDGSAGKRSIYARLPRSLPDGLAFAADGSLYVSCYAPARVYRVTPQREPEVLIDDWEAHTISNPTNIAFGGPKFDQLFVANLGRWHLSQIDLRRPGLPLPQHMGNQL